jgi:branched-subunit amino acid transport protein
MSIWLVMILGGLLTYGIRLSFIWLFERLDVPPLLRRALRFAPVAVLTVFVFQELLMPAGQLNISLANSRLLAGLLACVVAWRTKNTLITILAGMGALFLIQTFLHY